MDISLITETRRKKHLLHIHPIPRPTPSLPGKVASQCTTTQLQLRRPRPRPLPLNPLPLLNQPPTPPRRRRSLLLPLPHHLPFSDTVFDALYRLFDPVACRRSGLSGRSIGVGIGIGIGVGVGGDGYASRLGFGFWFGDLDAAALDGGFAARFFGFRVWGACFAWWCWGGGDWDWNGVGGGGGGGGCGFAGEGGRMGSLCGVRGCFYLGLLPFL